MTRQGKMMAGFLILLLLIFCAAVFRSNGGSDKPKSGKLTASEAAVRYPYTTLTDKEKALYSALYRGISNFETDITLPGTFTDQEYERIYLLVTMQEPELFYLSPVYELSSQMSHAEMHYSMTQEQAEAETGRLEAAADRIIAKLSPTQSEAQKLLMIHDAVAAGCYYAELGHYDSALGCLADGFALCEGYAKAFLYVARRAGMYAMCVTGRSMSGELHVWNIARINGQYYNIDVTWDDDSSFSGKVVHACFAVPDAQFGDHTADTRTYTPPVCAAADEGFYRPRGLLLSEQSQLSPRLQEWGAQANGVLEFQCASDFVYRDAKRSLRENLGVKETLRKACGGRIPELSFDDTRQVVIAITG